MQIQRGKNNPPTHKMHPRGASLTEAIGDNCHDERREKDAHLGLEKLEMNERAPAHGRRKQEINFRFAEGQRYPLVRQDPLQQHHTKQRHTAEQLKVDQTLGRRHGNRDAGTPMSEQERTEKIGVKVEAAYEETG